MNLEVVHNFFETIGGPLIVAILLWLGAKMLKLLKLISEIAAMKNDVTDLKSIACATICRLDAQDEATEQIFAAMKKGQVNGEATAAVGAMKRAKSATDDIIKHLAFERKEAVGW